jgi:hypothetical protein
MKKAILIFLLLGNITPAYAEDVAGYVKVDSSGNQIGQVIVCTPSVCGDNNSVYSKMTLLPGEQYVIQSKADSKGNVAGINPTPETQLKVDVATNQFTIVRTQEITPIVKKETVAVAPVEQTQPTQPTQPTVTYEPVTTMKVKTTTVETFNPITEQPVTVVAKKVVIEPVIDEPVDQWWEQWFVDLAALEDWFKNFFEGWVFSW